MLIFLVYIYRCGAPIVNNYCVNTDHYGGTLYNKSSFRCLCPIVATKVKSVSTSKHFDLSIIVSAIAHESLTFPVRKIKHIFK